MFRKPSNPFLLALVVAGTVVTTGGAPALARDASPAASPVGGQLSRFVLPGDAAFPEGITHRPGSPDFFVSSLADGAVFRGDLGNPELEEFLPAGADGRASATGLELDDQGRLFVAGGATGLVFVYDATTGMLLAKASAVPEVAPDAPVFVNDLAIAPDGAAYLTDSFRPVLYRLLEDGGGRFAVEDWLDLTGAGVAYADGFNFNGIVATPDGRFLIAVQSNTGKLFRIEIASKRVDEVALGGEAVTNGDGLVLDGDTLLVVRNQEALISAVRLTDEFRSGKVIETRGDALLAFPTTAAKVDDRLLVVNSQFDRRGGPAASAAAAPPELPFSIVAVPAA